MRVKKRNLYVDADSCPVKQKIVEISVNFNVDIVFVSSYAHVTNNFANDNCKWVYVDCEKEAADLYIVNNAEKNDIVVTQDIGLASILLLKGIDVLSPRGTIFQEKEMEMILELRHLQAKARRQGKHSKGPSRFSKDDELKFSNALLTILQKELT